MISRTAEYALRAVVYLATHPGSPISRSDIAEATCVPVEYLTKILQELDRADIVSSHRGPSGGYQLVIDPDVATVLDVVNVVSEVPRVRECPLGIESHSNLCPLHRRLDDAAAMVENAFRETFISEMIPGRQSAATCKFPRTE